jgi:hypothetical protein
MAMRKGLRTVRCFHLARATVFTGVAGFGKNFITFRGLWIRAGGLGYGFGMRPQAMKRLRKNGGLICWRNFSGGFFHKACIVLCWLVWCVGDDVKTGYAVTRRKVSRSSASSQSKVLFISGFSPRR